MHALTGQPNENRQDDDTSSYSPSFQNDLHDTLCELCVLAETTDFIDPIAVEHLRNEFRGMEKTLRHYTIDEGKHGFSFLADTKPWETQSLIAGQREEARRLAELEAYLDLIGDQPLHSVKRSALGMQFNLALYWLAYYIIENFKSEGYEEGMRKKASGSDNSLDRELVH